MIDLGKWLNEEIGVPFEGDPTDELIEYRDDDREDNEDDRSIE